MKKLIWHSNAPWAPTGYGVQSALFLPKLRDDFDVTISANFGLESAPIAWRGMPVLPGIGDSHGNEAIPGHVKAIFDDPREGLVFTLYDVQVFDGEGVFGKHNTVCWTPVDHCPLTPGQIMFFRQSGAIPLAMSRYGERELEEFDPLYVPHGVDTEVYQPGPHVRDQMGIPEDAFIIAMVSANKGRPSRKGFQQGLEAARAMMKKHDDVYLYLHTVLSPQFAHGEDIPALLAALEIPSDRVKMPQQYSMMFSPIDQQTMARIYSSFSPGVLLNPSYGEGFGVCQIEALACGIPVIATDASAMTEVVGDAGWLVKGRSYWTAQSSWMAIPDLGEIIEALEAAYAMTPSQREAMSAKAVEQASQYDADLVYHEHMLPALRECEQRFGNLAPIEVATE